MPGPACPPCSCLQYALTLLNSGGPALYDELKKLGTPLPSLSQLRKYKNYTADGPGWHPAACKAAADAVATLKADTRGGLAFDGCTIRSGCVFDVANDTLVGWCDVDPARAAAQLADVLAADAIPSEDLVPTPALATHVVTMVWTSLGAVPAR